MLKKSGPATDFSGPGFEPNGPGFETDKSIYKKWTNFFDVRK